MTDKTKRRLRRTADWYIAQWRDQVKFPDDLAAYFFIAGLLAMINTAYTLGRRDEARRRKASAARRWKRRNALLVTQRGGDAPHS